MTDDEFFEFLHTRNMEEQRRLEAEEEARYHAEQQLEHDLDKAARFLLGQETLPQVMVRLGKLTMDDYKEEEEPF